MGSLERKLKHQRAIAERAKRNTQNENPLIDDRDPATLPNIVCKKCKGVLFTQAYGMKRASHLETKNGIERFFHTQILNVCVKCGLPAGEEPPPEPGKETPINE